MFMEIYKGWWNILKIINNRQEELLKAQEEITQYNDELKNINAKIMDDNNVKWSLSVVISVIVMFIFLSVLPIKLDNIYLTVFKCVIITALSLIFGVFIGTKIMLPFYKPLEGIKHETESMHLAYLLNKYKPLAVARKGENYLLVLENRTTKIVVREMINLKYIEKTNINEIILDIDNEKLYIPYKK